MKVRDLRLGCAVVAVYARAGVVVGVGRAGMCDS